MKKPMTVTIDVETNPSRTHSGDPLEHMVWGRYKGHELGITQMMDAADKYGARLTFFHNYPEYHNYGNGMLDAARYIRERGHNVEIHLHPSRIKDHVFSDKGVPVIKRIQEMTPEVASVVMDHILELHEKATSVAATSFRGGAYYYTPSFLDVLRDKGITLVSNDNADNGVGVIEAKPRAPFRWDNGLLELPIANVPDWPKKGKTYAFNFNSAQFARSSLTVERGVELALDYLEHYDRLFPSGIPTMILHSWSLWRRDENRMFSSPGEGDLERFDQTMKAFSERYDVVGFDTIAADPERYGLDGSMPGQPPFVWEEPV